jgi:hypothetical protein
VHTHTEGEGVEARQSSPQIEIKEYLSNVVGDLQTFSFNLPTKFT